MNMDHEEFAALIATLPDEAISDLLVIARTLEARKGAGLDNSECTPELLLAMARAHRLEKRQ